MTSQREAMTIICEFDGCLKYATACIRSIRGVESFCSNHAAYVRHIEAEWGDAEREYLDQ